MDTDNYIVYIKTEYNDIDIAKNVKTRFYTSNYELERPLTKEKKKNIIGLMKDEFKGPNDDRFCDI